MTNTCSRVPRDFRRKPVALVATLCSVLVLHGCFNPIYPQKDREERGMEALEHLDERAVPPSPLTPSDAVIYALYNNLDTRIAEIETAYRSESAVAARRRLLSNLGLRYNLEHSNHPSARWSESTRTHSQSLESSFSTDLNHRQGEVSLMWNLLDFGVGYLTARRQGEKISHSPENYRRVRQQVVLEILSHYWRTAAAVKVAGEAEALRAELENQARAVRDSVDMRTLSSAEGARRELTIHAGLAELEQWRRVASQAKLDLARVLGCGNATGYTIQEFPEDIPDISTLVGDDPSALQTVALQRRPELFQRDAQERIAAGEARLALLQLAPNASLSLGCHDDPDKFLEWNNWMSIGAQASWNLFNIPARISEKNIANLQGKVAHEKGLALAAAIMAQVGIAYSDWKVSRELADSLARRTAVRERLVEALAAGESDGQTYPDEIFQERIRLLADRAATFRALAEARVAGARLVNSIGLDVDDQGRLLWQSENGKSVDLFSEKGVVAKSPRIRRDEEIAATIIPATVPGMKVVMAEDFESPAEYFLEAARNTLHKEEESTPRKPAPARPAPSPSEKKEAIMAFKWQALPITEEKFPEWPAPPLDDDMARINSWANRDGKEGAIVPPPPPNGFGNAMEPVALAKRELPSPPARMVNTAIEPERGEDAGRLVPAEEMRRLYRREKEDPKWVADSPARPSRDKSALEIPGIGIDDFHAAGTGRLKDPEAWKTPDALAMFARLEKGVDKPQVEWKRLSEEEILDLYSMGLVAGEEAFAVAAALEPLQPIAMPAPSSNGHELRPPTAMSGMTGNSVRPSGGTASPEDLERKQALAPLRLIGPEPVVANPEGRSLRPPTEGEHLAQLY